MSPAEIDVFLSGVAGIVSAALFWSTILRNM